MNDFHLIESPGADRPLTLRFTGSGSEYFRIWIVNLLLTVVTLGIYFPWARVRRLRYFYGSTLIGDDPLDFHGTPSRMLRGYALMGALFPLYSVAGKVSAWAGLVALVIMAAVGPALMRAGLRFRLANTSWRGLPFRFEGDLAGAYQAVLPLTVPAVVVSIGTILTAQGDAPTGRSSAWAGLGGLLIAALLPMSWWLLKRYQHEHYEFGQERTRFSAGVWPFYGVFLQLVGLALVFGLVGALAGAWVLRAADTSLFGGATSRSLAPNRMLFVFLVGLLAFYLVTVLAIRPFAIARLQNLVWNRTTSANLRFSSRLKARRMVLLALKNWTLTLVTVGFYAPFAAVATTRLRLEAMTIVSRIDPAEIEQLASAARVDGAAGDAAGELFGIDIGL